MQAHVVGGRPVWLAAFGDVGAGGRVIYMPAGMDAPEEMAALRPAVEAALAAGRCGPFWLAAFGVEDWNRDCSPWPAPPLSAKAGPFAGEAGALLAWLRDTLMPWARARCGMPGSEAIVGYSLAGLFALWALCEGLAVDACASCSGSLWYDGWMDYVRARAIGRPCRVYVSLGDREAAAKNPRMAAVGAATEQTVAWLRAQDAVAACEFVMHQGGHFTDVPGRLAAALAWLAG